MKLRFNICFLFMVLILQLFTLSIPANAQVNVQNPDLRVLLNEMASLYFAPNGKDLMECEENNPLAVAGALGHALYQQGLYLQPNPMANERYKLMYMDALTYLIEVHKKSRGLHRGKPVTYQELVNEAVIYVRGQGNKTAEEVFGVKVGDMRCVLGNYQFSAQFLPEENTNTVSQADALAINSLLLNPSVVKTSQNFDLEVNYQIQKAQSLDQVPLRIQYKIFKDQKTLFTSQPKEFKAKNSSTAKRVVHLKASSKPGGYKIEVTLSAGQMSDIKTVVLLVE